MVSSVSVLIVTFFCGDRFIGVRDVVSRFRFREGTASSISVDCGESSVLIDALLEANLEREERVDRRELEDVALIILEVS